MDETLRRLDLASLKKVKRQFFVRYFNAYLGNRTDKSKWRFPIELTLAYNSNAILGVITYWLQHDTQQSPEEIATMLIETILKGTFEASGLRSILKKIVSRGDKEVP